MVLDFAPVCEVAAEFIAHYGLQGRIRTHVGDMWQEPFPAADLHFYSGIYQNWPLEAEGRTLTRKSFESLTSGGCIIIHDMLSNDDKTGPFRGGSEHQYAPLDQGAATFRPGVHRDAARGRVYRYRGHSHLWLLEHRYWSEAIVGASCGYSCVSLA
jgi:hypothetical protein